MSDEASQLIDNSQPNLALAAKLKVAVLVLTIAVWGLVGLMRRPEKFALPEGVTLDFLPAVHATLNSIVAVCLVAALVMIKRGQVTMHRNLIHLALACSAVFLLCYVVYHFTHVETRYGGTGTWRVVYLVLLISHITLAALSFPLILQTWVYAWTNQFQKHRWMARITYPMWLYVAVTGPICYLMLRPYYG